VARCGHGTVTAAANLVSLSDAAAQFGPFEGRSWFNTAHQGPLPRRAVAAMQRAALVKAAPHRIADEDFRDVPERLRGLLAQLVGGAPEQIVTENVPRNIFVVLWPIPLCGRAG
jgi:kynureninase